MGSGEGNPAGAGCWGSSFCRGEQGELPQSAKAWFNLPHGMPSRHEQSVRVPIPPLLQKRESMVQHLISPTVSPGIRVGRASPCCLCQGIGTSWRRADRWIPACTGMTKVERQWSGGEIATFSVLLIQNWGYRNFSAPVSPGPAFLSLSEGHPARHPSEI